MCLFCNIYRGYEYSRLGIRVWLFVFLVVIGLGLIGNAIIIVKFEGGLKIINFIFGGCGRGFLYFILNN